MNKVKALIALLIPVIFLSGCMGGFDSSAFTKNPVVMVVIMIITLYVVVKMRSKK